MSDEIANALNAANGINNNNELAENSDLNSLNLVDHSEEHEYREAREDKGYLDQNASFPQGNRDNSVNQNHGDRNRQAQDDHQSNHHHQDITDGTQGSVSENYIPPFPSALVQLEIAKNEYEREKNRGDSLDNKAGIYIATIVAIVTVYIQILLFGGLVDAFEKAGKLHASLLAVTLVILVCGLVIMGRAFHSLTKAIALKDFKRVCLENLTDLPLLASPEDQTAEAMIRHYKSLIEYNENTNSDKAKDLNKGMDYSITGFIVMSSSTVALLIVLGWIR